MKIKIEDNKAIGYLQYPYASIRQVEYTYSIFYIPDLLTYNFYIDWSMMHDLDTNTVIIRLSGSITTMMYIRKGFESYFGLIDIMK